MGVTFGEPILANLRSVPLKKTLLQIQQNRIISENQLITFGIYQVET